MQIISNKRIYIYFLTKQNKINIKEPMAEQVQAHTYKGEFFNLLSQKLYLTSCFITLMPKEKVCKEYCKADK